MMFVIMRGPSSSSTIATMYGTSLSKGGVRLWWTIVYVYTDAPPTRDLPARFAPAAAAEWSRMELGFLALLAPLDDQLTTAGRIPERLGGAVRCRQDSAFDRGIGIHDFSLPRTTVPIQES